MGGAVNFCFRKENGDITFVEAGTRGMHEMCQHADMFKLKADYIEKTISACRYVKYSDNALFPSGYGLTVVDYKTKTILSCQGYSDLSSFFPTALADIAYAKIDKSDVGENISNGDELLKLGKLNAYFVDKMPNGYYGKVRDLDISGMTYFELCKRVDKNHSIMKKEGILYIRLNYSPFTYIKYKETVTGLANMRKSLEDREFSINCHEWNGFTESYRYAEE